MGAIGPTSIPCASGAPRKRRRARRAAGRRRPASSSWIAISEDRLYRHHIGLSSIQAGFRSGIWPLVRISRMSNSHKDELFPDNLQRAADLLRDGRPTLEQTSIDRVKQPAMNEGPEPTSSPEKGSFRRSRVATLLTAVFLLLGTGGTLAFAGADGARSSAASASFDQYRPSCVHGNGLGVANECPGEKVEPPPPSSPPPPAPPPPPSCVHGKGLGVANECPGEKSKQGGHHGKSGGHKGHKGKHKSTRKGGHKPGHKRPRKGSHKSGHGRH